MRTFYRIELWAAVIALCFILFLLFGANWIR